MKKTLCAFLALTLLLCGISVLAEEMQGPDLSGEWLEAETQFTQMTVEKNPENGWDIEIAAPLTHGAYIFKTTIRYDGSLNGYTYNKGKFWEVPITAEENPELGEAKIAGTEGTFTLGGSEEAPVLTWHDDQNPDIEVIFERADAIAEDDFAPMPDEAAMFEGEWQCGRASIEMYWEEDGFKVLIRWGSSAWEQTEWEYSCFYHEENNTLVSLPFGTCTEYIYGDGGEIVSATEMYNEGTAVFALTEDGFLTWTDEQENAGDGMLFRKMPEQPSLFATIGDAMDADGFTGMYAGSEDFYTVIVERDGAYLRAVAEMDEKGKKLSDAISEAEIDDIEAAFDAYHEYVKTLPISYVEEITAEPKGQEELDALAGKTLLEVEEAGYESSSIEYGFEDEDVVCTVTYGLFDYALILDTTVEAYLVQEENGAYGDLTVKSAALAGPSRNMADLSYHTDGTREPEEDPWAVFSTLMEKISDALSSGKDAGTIAAELAEAMPEVDADEIRTYIELFSVLSEQQNGN